MTAFLLYVALPAATLLIGAILGAFLVLGVGRKDAYTVDDDRSFEDQWRADLRTRPVFSSDPGQFYNQDEDPVRPMPYPKPRLVR